MSFVPDAGDDRDSHRFDRGAPRLDTRSSSVSTGDSPVVPVTTRPSLPLSCRYSRQRGDAVVVDRSVVVHRRDHRGEHRAPPSGNAAHDAILRRRWARCRARCRAWRAGLRAVRTTRSGSCRSSAWSSSRARRLRRGRALRRAGVRNCRSVRGHRASPSQIGCTALSTLAETGDNLGVVVGVVVAVQLRRRLVVDRRQQLPVRAQAQQQRVEFEERAVRRVDRVTSARPRRVRSPQAARLRRVRSGSAPIRAARPRAG